jgi:O-antigen ligase
MVVFSPWAFGTTQPWSIKAMNIAGYALGALLLTKWVARHLFGWQPERWGAANPSGWAKWNIRLLAAGTIAALAYCLISALNERARFVPAQGDFQYREALTWLPHSYNGPITWEALQKYLALALTFWAVRDWLLTRSRAEKRPEGGRSESRHRIPSRLKRLLWVLCLNGAVLALEGLIQRADGTTKLLWLVEPSINRTPDAQFGPYAYRSNGAQYLLMLWPVALGFWWMLYRSAQHDRKAGRLRLHNYLIPCILVTAIAPLASLSRAAVLIGAASVAAAMLILLILGSRASLKIVLAAALLLVAAAFVGTGMEWELLSSRFGQGPDDSGRIKIWQTTWKMYHDHPAFGSGPGTFSSIHYFYQTEEGLDWPAQAHCDWLEVLATFGWVGSSLVWTTLLLALVAPFAGARIRVPRVFIALLLLSLGTCLAFAAVDFPLMIYSILFEFILLGSLLTCVSHES